MSGDRELLELAAKAAGISGKYVVDAWINVTECGFDLATGIEAMGHGVWNPLTDDGDALRLAVKLRLDIEFHSDRIGNAVTAINYELAASKNQQGAAEVDGEDLAAATRRAIVRAAAEIGRASP
jgi:hypothetical protein